MFMRGKHLAWGATALDFVTNFFSHTGPTQLLLFLVVLTSLWLLEWAVLPQTPGAKVGHTLFNTLFMPTAVMIQCFMMLLCFDLAGWVASKHLGLVYFLPNADSPWIKYGLMFVVLDALDYLYHRLMHGVPFFWRFHLAHHTDKAVDVSTTFREHPGETMIRNGFLMLWVLVSGASMEVLILRQTFQTVANIFAHTALRLPEGPNSIIEWIFVTPNFHHVHHHFQMPATNYNYGDVFSVWDRLFGTSARMPSPEIVFGLDTHMDYSWLGFKDQHPAKTS